MSRFAMTSLIHKLGWSSVAAITADGERYADYMSSLQVDTAEIIYYLLSAYNNLRMAQCEYNI